ncbi:hypothetical protein I350_02384 [Cryptococcus amylolentus CBS 6273]|uniref:beta-mannosidase n=1 Tax=Cryptococcus amylolentus CBS 6273 TaxID=1296118 RepID=A0A1E3KAY5_9TREE|nr:hypothetical protein I350_02384 [Cryptococcus amylolentus CBS 6273]
MTPSTIPLQKWRFRQKPKTPDPDNRWTSCWIPTSVQAELIKTGDIKDPRKDLNEWDAQWIGEADWEFQCDFDIPADRLKAARCDLVFEGLDTYCDVLLNDRKILSSDNMFVAHRVSCKEHIRSGKNRLLIVFKSPWQEAKQAERAHGGPRGVWNGDPCRLYSRKAQYGWGWDWGPKLLTVGPWRPITLESYDFRIEAVRIEAHISSPDLKIATLRATVDAARANGMRLRFLLFDQSGVCLKEEMRPAEDSWVEWTFEDGQIHPWWPRGYGAQELYQLRVELWKDGQAEPAAHKSIRLGFRHIEVVERPFIHQRGTSFFFKVNGVPIFCGGSNWIPADIFATDISPKRYRQWVEKMVQGNQKMLRIWGGGMYEHDELYNACDELGVLVWQDFMFACGIYPSYAEFNNSVKNEAEQAVKRLRDHPSVVIFAGNNEDYQVAESLKIVDYTDESGDYMHSEFPGRHIYEIILPEVVHCLSDIHYHRSSPYGGKTSRDPAVGDIHQWNVWHGTQEPWSKWGELSGRFVSEFGMQAYPNLKTVQTWSDNQAELFPQSRVSSRHNKAIGAERRLESYIMENFEHAYDMPSYIYYSQIMQAECLAAAYRAWRRNWKGEGKEYTAGALVWQLNDCWPCTSWSIIDYYMRPKPAYFTIKRELETYTVGISRKEIKKPKDKTTDAAFEIFESAIWGCNSSLILKPVTIVVETWHLHRGILDRKFIETTLKANASTEIWSGPIPRQPVRSSLSQPPEPIIVSARLLARESELVLARHSSWPEPYKYLRFPEPGLKCQVSEGAVRLSCERPIKGIVLNVEGDEVEWDDQGIDLIPGDDQVIAVKGLEKRAVTARYLGSDGL